jgi:hypothetical protein
MPTFWLVLGKAWPMRSSWETELQCEFDR